MNDARRTTRVVAAVAGAPLALGVALGARAPADHRIALGSGVAAIGLLLAALLASPASRLGHPALLALRAGRRTLGLAAAAASLVHALVAWIGYLPTRALGPLVSLPWLRDGVLALALLLVLALTSFPSMNRALRVRAWSALHRAVYAAAVLAVLHAAATPFGPAWVGVGAGVILAIALISRPVVALVRRRAAASAPADSATTDAAAADPEA